MPPILDVEGICPACGSRKLHRMSSGMIQCLHRECSDPTAAHKLLSRETVRHGTGNTVTTYVGSSGTVSGGGGGGGGGGAVGSPGGGSTAIDFRCVSVRKLADYLNVRAIALGAEASNIRLNGEAPGSNREAKTLMTIAQEFADLASHLQL